MRHLLSLACVLLGLGSSASQTLAQSPNSGSVRAEDRTAIASCVRESLDRPQACIGAVAVVCARQAQGDRREAEIACTRREAAVWRERLDLAAMALAQRLESGQRSRFAAGQRTWESYVGLNCAFVGEITPPATAPVMQSGCELRSAATRAIEVEGWVRRLARRSEPRPQLHR
jgi:Lysozyme inhibitor LprI